MSGNTPDENNTLGQALVDLHFLFAKAVFTLQDAVFNIKGKKKRAREQALSFFCFLSQRDILIYRQIFCAFCRINT